MGRILIVEDDRSVQKALKRLFESEGYSVVIRADGKSALKAFHGAAPTAIVLELGLPKVSGQDVCREVRRQSLTVPIIILSGVSDIEHKISLLELGADDYVTKPFSPRELLARVRAAIRYADQAEAQARPTFDGVCIDFAKMEVTRDGSPVRLTALEFKILRFFVQNAQRVISREELLKEVYGHDGTSHAIREQIYCLRRKLERNSGHPVHFCTVRDVGYKFIT
jgi:DNA-binding response OmpR family regulator